jgi:predicted aspartyl protease
MRRVLSVSFLVVSVICSPSSGCAQRATLERPVAQQVANDYRFAYGQSSLRIPIEEDDGYIFLELRINDSGPLLFGVDTGATHTLIDRRLAESLNLKADRNEQIAGAGGIEEAAILKNVSIKLPGAELHNQTLWAIPLNAIAAANGHKMVGILGYELFKYFVVDIDYAAAVMNLYEPASYEYRGAGQSIPLNVQQDGEIYVKASVQAPGGNPVEGEFVIDTGGNRTLLLARDFVEQHQLLKSVEKTLLVRGGGRGGRNSTCDGKIEESLVGPV